MSATLKQHIAYSKSPALFMSQKWLTFDVFNTRTYKNITPFDYQLKFIDDIHKNNCIVTKSRQMGVTSMMELYIAWYVIFNESKTVFIIGASLESSKRILDGVKIILQNYSVDDEKDGIVKNTYFHWEDDFLINNKTELRLKNRCIIKAASPSIEASRGYSVDFMYIDEAAFTNNFEEIYAASGICMQMNKNSKFIIASNPKDNSSFNRLFLNAVDGGYFKQIKLHWSINPKYSKDIKEEDSDSPFKYSSPWFYEMFNRLGNDIKSTEQELECIVRYKDETNKTKTISLRMDGDLHKKLQDKLNPGVSISDYIRTLIEKDLEN